MYYTITSPRLLNEDLKNALVKVKLTSDGIVATLKDKKLKKKYGKLKYQLTFEDLTKID